MGWVCALQPGCGLVVYEVEEPAGKPPKGRVTMFATEVERCSSGEWTGHFVREIYATKAEAEKVALVEEAYREWSMTNSNDAKRVQAENPPKLHRAEKRPQFRASAAYHEAGHAVAGVALSMQLESISLHPDKSRGTLEWYSEARTTFIQGKKNMYGDEGVMILLAGNAAQKRHAPSSKFTAMGDYEKAESLVFCGPKAEEAVHALFQK